ncbi:hypothetical protein RJ639_001647 [Escallonia herrerae]|uniref:Integrase zinc-binding domain-containing protein n=1 Tax=Escallonia herrerae TaxID=1293975 RepID=A0AA89BGS4_9ASTE|nr:hypothetical protein RJ639_001647 [Escallonia herrerae]
MANSNERINALEAQIRDMLKSDQDAPGILKQFSLRFDALEVNLEATDNVRYAENMKHPPTNEQTDTQDYEDEDVVGAFPQWCNAVTMQVGNPEESLTGEKPKDMPLKKRWQELLAEFNFILEYRAGSTNSVANAFSRRAELDQVVLMAMNAILRADSRVAINIGNKIRKALTKDLVALQLLKLIESGKTRQFWQEDGLPMTKGRHVNVPRVDDLRRTLIRECHDTLWAGHAGGERTLAFLQQGYYWPRMGDEV